MDAQGLFFGLIGEEYYKPTLGAERDIVAKGFVQGGLPPAVGMEAVKWPAEAVAIDWFVRGHGEDAHLLTRKGGEGAAAGHGAETAVVGEHRYFGPGMFLGKGDKVADIAKRMVFALAGGTENCVVGSG